MGTTDIHEPEVKESNRQAVLRRRCWTAGQNSPEPICAQSHVRRQLLEFGQARKAAVIRHFTSLYFQLLRHRRHVVMPLLFTEDLPKAQLLTFWWPASPSPPSPPPAAAQVRGWSSRSRPIC